MTKHDAKLYLDAAKHPETRRALAEAAGIKSHENNHHSPTPRSEPEPFIRDDIPGTPRREAEDAGRVSVSITSYRRRLTDPDNLCGKYFLDLCRYSRLIRDDRQEDIDYKISQVKVRGKENEKTVIEIDIPTT